VSNSAIPSQYQQNGRLSSRAYRYTNLKLADCEQQTDKLTVGQLFNKFTAFYKGRNVLAAFTSPPQESVPSQINLIHNHVPYFFIIHGKIIVPFTSRSSKLCFSFRVTFYRPVYATCPVSEMANRKLRLKFMQNFCWEA
jgi:hypothetical protein